MATCNITEKEFDELANYIKRNYGIDLTRKKTLVLGRMQNYLIENNYKSYTEYYEHLKFQPTGKEATVLINRITTNHTFFMREAEHFRYFKNIVLPHLVHKGRTTKDLRIWSAGCSTGEEPYTLAMIIADYFGDKKYGWDTKILATDISTRVLQVALKGEYANEAITPLLENWKMQHFKRVDEEWSQVTDKIKEEIIFRKFNLMNEQFPFKKKFQVIFCRNVMIYFDGETKRQLIDKFYDATEKGGYLFIGQSESLMGENSKYKYIMPAVYRKE